MPVSNCGDKLTDSSKKRPNSFSIDSIIGKKFSKSQPGSRSPSSSPENTFASSTTTSLPLGLPYPSDYALRCTTSNRISDHSSSELFHPHHHHHLHSRSLASLGMVNAALPPMAFVHHTYQSPSVLHHHPSSAQFHPAFFTNQRENHLFPWLLGRGDHLFSPRYQAGHEVFLQPFRKAKRIRTAFSPSQLLKLEQSFDKNHYVVGQERKELASKLSLTETQVKVWFQNRRTKYKRIKYEEGGEHSPLAGTSCDIDDNDLEDSKTPTHTDRDHPDVESDDNLSETHPVTKDKSISCIKSREAKENGISQSVAGHMGKSYNFSDSDSS